MEKNMDQMIEFLKTAHREANESYVLLCERANCAESEAVAVGLRLMAEQAYGRASAYMTAWKECLEIETRLAEELSAKKWTW